MNMHKITFLFMLLTLGLIPGYSQEALEYEINAPLNSEENIIYSVYSEKNITVIFRHYDNEKPGFKLRKDLNLLVTGTKTKNKLCRIKELDDHPVLVPMFGNEKFKAGEMWKEKRFGKTSFIRIDDLKFNLIKGKRDSTISGYKTKHFILKGSYIKNKFDKNKELINRKEYSFNHDLWFTKKMDHNIASFSPLLNSGSLFTNIPLLNRHIYNDLKNKFKKNGLLLKMQYNFIHEYEKYRSQEFVLEVRNVRKTQKRPISAEDVPFLEKDKFKRAFGLTFVSNMITAEFKKTEKNTGQMSSLLTSKYINSKLQGHALYGTNDINDIALALVSNFEHDESQTQNGEYLFLFLLKPGSGSPKTTSYKISNKYMNATDDLTLQEVKELTQYFSVMALFIKKNGSGRSSSYYLFENPKGVISFDKTGKTLKGEIKLDITGFKLNGSIENTKLSIQTDFAANHGLQKIGESKLARKLPKNKVWKNLEKALKHPELVYNLKYENNDITKLPEKISNFKNLRELTLNCDQLLRLPDYITDLKDLNKLKIKSEKLKQLPEKIGDLKKLEQISISAGSFGKSKLISIPSSIGSLNKLSELTLSSTNINSLQPEICKLEQLEKLSIYGSNISKLPENISNLKNLKYLQIGNSKLTDIPNSLGKLKNLQTLNLRQNPLEKIKSSTLKELVNLEKINLSYCTSLNKNEFLQKTLNVINQLPNMRTLSLKYRSNHFSNDEIKKIRQKLKKADLRY